MVATARGDDLIAAGVVPTPHVVKLDVEGHEASVLRGMGDALRHPACLRIVFEDAPDDQSEVKLLLRAAGFQVTPLERRQCEAHALLNFVAHKSGAT